MIHGLKFIKDNDGSLEVYADDDSTYNFDNEDDFLANAVKFYEPGGYSCYYFGGGDDGAMRTGKTTVEVDGENHNFYFEKSGGNKGAGVTGEKDDKLYQSGMLLSADSDTKYQVVRKITTIEKDSNNKESKKVTYQKLDDAEAFLKESAIEVKDLLENVTDDSTKISVGNSSSNVSKKASDLKEAYNITYKDAVVDGNVTTKTEYILVNTSGKVIDNKGKNKDGNDFYYITSKKSDGTNSIVGIYVED